MENENQNQNPNPPTGGLKLMTVFIVVLALHVLVIGGVSAYSLLKGNQETVSTEAKVESTETAAPVEAPSVDVNAPILAEAPANIVTPTEVSPVAPEVKYEASIPVAAAPVKEAPVSKGAAIASAGSYSVKAGDTLSKIARLHGMKVADLKSLNGLASDKLKIGQALKISSSSPSTVIASAPAPESTVIPASAAPIQPKTTGSKTAAYTVNKGDTLIKIARQFGTTPSAIMAANKLSDARKLKIGMKLSIPSGRQEMTDQVKPATPALQSQATPAADFAMAK